MTKIAAIVPAYNEAGRIGKVLEVLTSVPSLDEIIVIDDGSSDSTLEEAKKFQGVKCLKNEKNLGKAATMQKGVDATDAKYLFFCDADLQGLRAEIIEEIIQPVIKGETDMFIAVRANKLHRAFKAIGLLSGERVLKRELWDMVPKFYKYRFRIEFGLNSYADHYGNGYQYKVFENYYLTFKEVKYGIWKGFIRRMWMYWDIFVAYLAFYLFHVPKGVKLMRMYIFRSFLALISFLVSAFFLFTATSKGYGLFVGSIKKWVLKDPDASIALFIFRHLKDFTVNNFMILGFVFLGIGAVLLVWNIVKMARVKRLKVISRKL
ncbi:MAG: glycosyltransferase [Candidatus Gracilibacteria bacterium]